MPLTLSQQQLDLVHGYICMDMDSTDQGIFLTHSMHQYPSLEDMIV